MLEEIREEFEEVEVPKACFESTFDSPNRNMSTFDNTPEQRDKSIYSFNGNNRVFSFNGNNDINHDEISMIDERFDESTTFEIIPESINKRNVIINEKKINKFSGKKSKENGRYRRNESIF